MLWEGGFSNGWEMRIMKTFADSSELCRLIFIISCGTLVMAGCAPGKDRRHSEIIRKMESHVTLPVGAFVKKNYINSCWTMVRTG